MERQCWIETIGQLIQQFVLVAENQSAAKKLKVKPKWKSFAFDHHLPILFLVDFLQNHAAHLHRILGCCEKVVDRAAI